VPDDAPNKSAECRLTSCLVTHNRLSVTSTCRCPTKPKESAGAIQVSSNYLRDGLSPELNDLERFVGDLNSLTPGSDEGPEAVDAVAFDFPFM